MSGKNVLGIDIGSISISVVEMSRGREVVRSGYAFHEGHVRETLSDMLRSFNFSDIDSLAITSSSPDIFSTGVRFDSRISFISAAKHVHGKPGAILIIGGEKFGLAMFDESGNYRNYKSNTSCAAGTGSFLEQQAKRLNLKDIQTFSGIAGSNTGNIPKIASRCAVFAKTDLIHAQQEGYSLAEICDGLCHGLAKSVADTLFGHEDTVAPIVMAGGVSKNRRVVKHLSSIIGQDIIVDENSHIFGAMGCAFLYLEGVDDGSVKSEPVKGLSISNIFKNHKKEKKYHYEPLELKLSDYPDFKSLDSYEFTSKFFPMATPVEVDIYRDLSVNRSFQVYLGIDIGSTSTKAAIVDSDGEVVAGLYTRTAGRPVEAVQSIFEAVDDIAGNFEFSGVGTTGSGRKFIGKIIGADLAIDEITAHARAAYMLDPEVDTIIEIGGQDAKFTTLKNGMVTFSIMNNVCAAGTGSFIEEQAGKLSCPLSEYAGRAAGLPAPLSSDRCTVFMERDLNHYLSENYTTDEVLASVLHSVRDNYLTKVAIEKNIGNKIFFQGATAKNIALVAAFEQRLGKPVMVSKFCHLTGALGSALTLIDQKFSGSSFRGIDIYKQSIPVKSEVCGLCNNSCKIKIAEVNGESVAFGFLCGRDYETRKYVNQNSSGFDLLKERRSIQAVKPLKEYKYEFTMGIPAALHLFDEMFLWKEFFTLLGIRTITTENYKDGIKEGKRISGSEFCAPMSEVHGHVLHLADKSDYIFLPVFLEQKSRSVSIRRNYCYYTQYLSPVINSCESILHKDKILAPVLRSLAGSINLKLQLFKMLKSIPGADINFMQVSSAYETALKKYSATRESMTSLYKKQRVEDDVNVVLLGRPYTVLSPSMNKGIPDFIGKLGAKVFFQDMLTPDAANSGGCESLLKVMHWNYAASILESAEIAAKTEWLYPVLVTSFKCTPDAYTVEYFKKIMDSHNKPYLILQLDEHDSNVGYETRIEAGLRSFRNHFNGEITFSPADYADVNPVVLTKRNSLLNKTLLIPRWDGILGEFMAALLQREGLDARMVDETHESIQRSLSHNTGQCIPLNIIIQNFVEYVKKYDLDPAETVLWNIDSKLSCNLGMFPYYSKTVLESMGGGFEKAEVYAGSITLTDISYKAAFNMYIACMFAGMLRRIGCHIRPYEVVPGTTDDALDKSIPIITEAFKTGRSKEKALDRVIKLFEKIEVIRTDRPKVAIFGDLYARDNEVLNQNIISVIEKNGGEVITTPYSELVKIIAEPYIKKWFKEGNYIGAFTSHLMKQAIVIFENRYYPYFNRVLKGSPHVALPPVKEVLEKFNMTIDHSGESMENALKIYSLMMHHPDLKLFVQTNPAFCCPSLVTEAMSHNIELVTDIPIVTIEYDGTGGFKNDDIIPYLKYPRSSSPDGEENDKLNCA
jgi:predicted CoA-substrate-specific enzyme activase